MKGTNDGGVRRGSRGGRSWVVLAGLLIFALTIAIDKAVRSTDHWNGFLAGMFYCMFVLPVVAVAYLPWCLVFLLICDRRRWNRARTWLLLAPPLVLCALMIFSLVRSWPYWEGTFPRYMKTALPADAVNMRYFHGPGGIDTSASYCFETSPAEVSRLIAEMHLKEDKHWNSEGGMLRGRDRDLLPDFRNWEEPKRYHRHVRSNLYELITDRERRRVYVSYVNY